VITADLELFGVRPADFKIRCATHLFASSVRTPSRLTAGGPGSPSVVVTMSIHKLSAGSGYDYLTRQVAALDATEKGDVGLASYYTERGESPGSWIGSGLAGIDGLSVGDAVSAAQMRSLFGAGMHPLATQRLEQLDTADLTDANIKTATQLGAPFKVYAGEVSPFRIEVAKRIAAQEAAPDSWETIRSLLRVGRVSVPRSRESSSEHSMAAIRSMPGRSPRPLLRSRVRALRRSPAMT
jgi:TrwC relaxase